MAHCPRCSGLLIDEPHRVKHCLNCGYYSFPEDQKFCHMPSCHERPQRDSVFCEGHHKLYKYRGEEWMQHRPGKGETNAADR